MGIRIGELVDFIETSHRLEENLRHVDKLYEEAERHIIKYIDCCGSGYYIRFNDLLNDCHGKYVHCYGVAKMTIPTGEGNEKSCVGVLVSRYGIGFDFMEIDKLMHDTKEEFSEMERKGRRGYRLKTISKKLSLVPLRCIGNEVMNTYDILRALSRGTKFSDVTFR